MVAQFPEQRFVIDHLAKPHIKDKNPGKWAIEMRVLSKYKNVSCKISGMVTEAEWNQWTSDEFEPYIDSVTDAFGVDRVMFGSDWPVCLLSASYKEVYHIVKDHFSGYSETEQEQIFGGNAIKFYKL